MTGHTREHLIRIGGFDESRGGGTTTAAAKN